MVGFGAEPGPNRIFRGRPRSARHLRGRQMVGSGRVPDHTAAPGGIWRSAVRMAPLGGAPVAWIARTMGGSCPRLQPVMSTTLRRAVIEDLPFIEAMLLVAAEWDETLPKRPPEAWLDDDHMRRYIQGWGRPGDVGFVAEEDGAPVGAAWRRLYPHAAPGYGFISEEVPEVSIGVRHEWRGRGIGASLLRAIAAEARASGLRELSLAVEIANPAQRLYLREGFRIVRTTDEDHLMRLDLWADRADPGSAS